MRLPAVVAAIAFLSPGAAAQTQGIAGIAASDSAYLESQVQKPVSPKDARQPRYPEALRRENISGDVVAQFVVDTAGIPDMKTFRILESNHDLFSDSVREAVAAMTFYPAELNGRRVPQILRPPFSFRRVR